MFEGAKQALRDFEEIVNFGPPHMTRDLAAIVALVVLVTVPSMFTRDLWNPDEPRYMEVAREMVLLGSPVLPQLNGEVYSDKPPMFFWLAGTLWRAGLGYNSGRIVTAAAVLGTLLLTCWQVRRKYGSNAALLTGGAAVSSVMFLGFGKIGVLDPLLMFFVATSLVLGYAAFDKEARHSMLCWLGCYTCWGLGVLTKGPVGMLVPALILLVYAILERRNIRIGGKAHAAGIVLCTGIVFAWLVPAIIEGGSEYARIILVKQSLGRMVRSYSHRNPIYYYVIYAPLWFLPWSFVLPLAVAAAIRQWRRSGDSLPLFATVWLCVPLLFFSFISGKRINYIVPALPAAAILTGWYFASFSERKGRLLRAKHLLTGACFLLVAILSSGLIVTVTLWPHFAKCFTRSESILTELSMLMTPARVTGTAFALTGICALSVTGLFLPAGKRFGQAVVIVTSVVILSLLTDLAVLPVLNRFKSGRNFAITARQYRGVLDRIYMFSSDYSGVYNLYTGYTRIPVVHDAAELRALLNKPNVLVIGDMKSIRKALDSEEQERFILLRETVGHRTMALLRGRPDMSPREEKRPFQSRIKEQETTWNTSEKLNWQAANSAWVSSCDHPADKSRG